MFASANWQMVATNKVKRAKAKGTGHALDLGTTHISREALTRCAAVVGLPHLSEEMRHVARRAARVAAAYLAKAGKAARCTTDPLSGQPREPRERGSAVAPRRRRTRVAPPEARQDPWSSPAGPAAVWRQTDVHGIHAHHDVSRAGVMVVCMYETVGPAQCDIH